MIGISEGMVLAERYRLVRRHEDLGTGEFWGGVDQETGSEVWVCFSDKPGLGRIAEEMRTWKAAATPQVLDEGEVRLILDSRTLGASGAVGRAATHVEVVVEFAVQAPALGKPLTGRIVRRPLAPAEALSLVALLAAALEEALEAGYSHGWISATSAWNLRKRACLVDMVAGLATADEEKVEVAEQVTGFFAPERIAGGGANEAADVFALGWLLYASLVGLANLDSYHKEAIEAAGAASTAELLAVWRERSREHVRALLGEAEDSALLTLLLGALAERAADRPTLAAFRAAAAEAARGLAGAAALVVYSPKKRPVAGVAAEAGVIAAEVVAGALAAGLVADVVADELSAGAGAAGVGAAGAGAGGVAGAGAGAGAGGVGAAGLGAGDAAAAGAGAAGIAAGAIAGAGVAAAVVAAGAGMEAASFGSEGAAGGAGLAGAGAEGAAGGAGSVGVGETGAAGVAGGAGAVASEGAAGGAGAAGAEGGAGAGGAAAAGSAGALGAVGGAGAAGAVAGAAGAAAGSGGAAGAGAGAGAEAGELSGASVTSSAVEAETVIVAGSAGAAGAGAGAVAGAGLELAAFESAGAGGGAGSVATAAEAAERHRPRLSSGVLVACGVALLAVGIGTGYAFGASGNQGSTGGSASSKSGVALGAAASSSGAACAPTASASAGAVAAAASTGSVNTSATGSAAASAAASGTATWNENAALPLPTSNAGAVTQLTQIVQGAESSGLISSTIATTLLSEITTVQNAVTSGSAYHSEWEQLSSTIQSGKSEGTIPAALTVQLNSALSYLYVATGS